MLLFFFYGDDGRRESEVEEDEERKKREREVEQSISSPCRIHRLVPVLWILGRVSQDRKCFAIFYEERERERGEKASRGTREERECDELFFLFSVAKEATERART